MGTWDVDTWSIQGPGIIYRFPLGDVEGHVGQGDLVLYGNVEGITFINASQIAICSDKAKNDQPDYQKYKEMTVSIFNILP
jgi:hypothetical protein